jgi:hypothetical protein
MKSIKRHLTLPAFAVTTLVITACGGGGGGGGVSGTPTTEVSLTTTNAKAVSAEVIDSSNTVQGTVAGPAVLTGVSISASTSDFSYPALVVQQLTKVQALELLPSANLSGAIATTVLSCSTSGQLTLSGSDPDDSNDITTGDTINIAFEDCVEDGVTVDGSISMAVTDISAGFDGTPPYELDVVATLTNLSVSTSGYSATSSGDITMGIEDDGSNNETYDLSGSTLTSTVGGQTVVLTDYRYQFSSNSDSGDYSYDLQGTLASAAIDGKVSYTTTTPFAGTDPDNPTAGELHVTGANGSQAWVTADSDGATVYIDVDADGDDTAETQITSSWTELESL